MSPVSWPHNANNCRNPGAKPWVTDALSSLEEQMWCQWNRPDLICDRKRLRFNRWAVTYRQAGGGVV